MGVPDLASRFHAATEHVNVEGWTDSETHHKNVLTVLSECVTLAEARSRVVVPLFLLFLRDDYYGAANRDDLDAKEVSSKRSWDQAIVRVVGGSVCGR